MNKQVFRGLLSDFKYRISRPLSEELKRHKDWLGKMPLGVFLNFISAQWGVALKYVKQSCSRDFPGAIALAYLAAELNGALPMNYPYIVVLVNFKNDPEMVFISAIRRKFVPGILECLRPRIVPICYAEDKHSFLEEKLDKVTEYDFREMLRVHLERNSV